MNFLSWLECYLNIRYGLRYPDIIQISHLFARHGPLLDLDFLHLYNDVRDITRNMFPFNRKQCAFIADVNVACRSTRITVLNPD